ncbi:MAG: response regulator [Proteobacteria bacterium]|nr:response regulator [Pseudomonadota bacterium]
MADKDANKKAVSSKGKTTSVIANDSPYRILGIEGSNTQRKILESFFVADMFDLTVTDSGKEGIKLLSESEFDVLLLDVEIAGLDGFQICQHIRDKMKKVILPIIFVSSHVSKDFIQKALSVGGDEFIVKPLDMDNVLGRVHGAAKQNRMFKRLDHSELVLFSVAHMAEALDVRSGDHCDRLMHMCGIFAEKLGLSEEDKMTLNYASILHDIGKLAVGDKILTKESPLEEDEWSMMKRHTVIGASFCAQIKSCGAVVDIIRHHHEKFDGTGYPDGLKGEEIPYLARVFQVVDIYDSMSNNRNYNEAFPRDRVISIMAKEAQKGMRDSELMKSFLDIVSKNPDLLERKTLSAQPMSTYKINAIIDSTMKTSTKSG